MTTRFSLSELAEMMNLPVDAIRAAVESLAEAAELTAESFRYADKNWRVAPSDVKRVQEWIEQKSQSGEIVLEKPKRRIKSKKIMPLEDTNALQ